MPGPAVILREIHRLSRHAKELEREIERSPRLLKAQQTKVARQEETLREAQESLKHLKVAIHDKEVTLRGKNQEITKHERQLNEATSKKEYDALKAEIASERNACRKLEDDILNDMALSEERAAQLPELERAVQRAKDEVAQFDTANQARAADLKKELSQVSQNLQDIEATLPPDIQPTYQRLVTARGEDALAPVQNRTCTACYTEITAQNYNELVQAQFVLCKNCGRILYLPE
jgi:predicted  nucleic acid-binding Zn-ribbon protein